MKKIELSKRGGNTTVPLCVKGIYAVYKGANKLEGEKLEKIRTTFRERGEIRIREHERMIFGTDVEYPILPEVDPIFDTLHNFLTEKGFLVSAITPWNSRETEILIMVMATNPYLSPIKMDEAIMTVTLRKSSDVSFKLVES